MNAATKRFLLAMVAIALAGWIGGNMVFGGPGLSKDYLAANKAEHDHYLEIIKSEEYKRYAERPHLMDLADHPGLAENVAFAENYAAREDFAEEQHRRHIRGLYFDFFNASLVIILLWKLARPPLMRFLDDQVEQIRERLDQVRRAREAAESRLAAAQERVAHIHEEEMKVHQETESRVEREMAELAAANHYSFGLQERDLIERKRALELAAEQKVRRALVESAITEALARLDQERGAGHEDLHLEQFIRGLEAKR